MQNEQSEQNNYNNLQQRRSIGHDLHNFVFPQIKGLISDAEIVLRSESRLLEAHIFNRVKKLQRGLVLLTIGAGALLLALGLFVFTIIFEIIETFPGVPIWSVTGLMSVMICILGGVLLNVDATSSHLPKREEVCGK